MVRKKIDVILDDLTGETVDESDVVTLSVTLEGRKLELDTTEPNKAKAVRRVLAALNQLPHQQIEKAELVNWINQQSFKDKKGNVIKLKADLRGRIADEHAERYDAEHGS